jgi:hypothetical protein
MNMAYAWTSAYCITITCLMTETPHIRWCDTCEHWVHEHCAGQTMQRSYITPAAGQSYLNVDAMDAKRKDAMPSDVQVILGWPICRLSKIFTVDGKTFWHPYSMELVVKMAREWYYAGIVPSDWEKKMMDIHKDTEFMRKELQVLLEASCPPFYHCPECASYI